MTNRLIAFLLSAATVATASGATSIETDRFDKRGNPKPLLNVFKVTPIEQRLPKIRPVAAGELRVTPLFAGCSVVWGAEKEIPGLALEYRAAASGTWRKAPPIPYFPNCRNYRGSILNLDESTDYAFRLAAGGKTFAEGKFRTWSSEVPVAKTVVIDPATAKWPVKIDAKGTPKGWIRYTTKKGAVIDTKGKSAFVVSGAAYVLLDDMILHGGREPNMIKVEKSKGVRIRHCEIYDWGRDGKPDYSRKGLWHEIARPKASIDFDGAITIARGASEVVVERCYVHDAHSRSVSWYYAHPAGPEAVTMCCPDHSTVLRWNDFVGSDVHPWNDAVEGAGNFSDDGGFNRDAEVTGNFMICSNDDSIELDGGQQNVRCHGNRFEGSGCGVSIQGCMVSPTYVYDNLFSGLGEEQLLVMQTIKTSSFDQFGNGSWAWIAGNTFWGDGTGVNIFPGKSNPLALGARYNVFDNRFSGPRQKLVGTDRMDYFEGAGNTFEDVAFDERKLDPSYPKRPLGFLLDTVKISRRDDYAPAKVVATSTSGKPVRFRIRQNADFGWFAVSPAEGVIPAHGKVELTVTFLRERMNDRRHYRGAFLVQDPRGLSRPVSIHALTDFVPPYRAEKPGETALYAAEFKPGEWREPPKEWQTFTFDIPRDGTWYFLIHAYKANFPDMLYSHGARLTVQVDDDEALMSRQQIRNYPTWTLLMPGKNFGNFACPFELKAGRHTVKIRRYENDVFSIDGLVATDACGSFEPR